MEANLKELFISSMSGNKEAYESFLELVSIIVKRYLFFLGGKYAGTENMEDLHQEVLLSIHEKKHTYQTQRPILPWIYAITRYRFIDFYRASKRSPKSVEFDESIFIQDEEPLLDLEELFSSLTHHQKEMLMMVKVDGLSYAEAAGNFDVSVTSLKVRIHRIMQGLKDKVQK